MPGAPSRLRCEYLTNPLGIDERHPRLSWWVDDPRPAEIQTAYHLLAASSRDLLDVDDGDFWDTGRVDSAQSVNVEYAGSAAKSGQRVWWKVRSYDSDGLGSPWSEPAYFEMGLVEKDQWRAKWIRSPMMGDRRTPTHVPALRRSFTIDKPVSRARLYVTARGVYDLYLNGQRAIDCELAPGWTDYRQRLQYQTFDVGNYLVEGENVIGALLGDGWFCGALGVGTRQAYGDRPELFLQLNVQFEDWTHAVVESDHQWKWQRSHIVAADLCRGESIDGRQRLGGWNGPGYGDEGWFPVDVVDRDEVLLCGTSAPAVRVLQTLAPVATPGTRQSAYGERRWLFDFGQNIVGRVRMKVRAERGTLFRLRYAERLAGDGAVPEAFDDDHYTAAGTHAAASPIDATTELAGGFATAESAANQGDGDGEWFEPRLSFHGFQYVEVSVEQGGRAVVMELAAQVLGSALDVTGYFHCDDPALTQLQQNIRRSQQGSFLDVPMDSPQSTRRLGWAGNAQSYARTASFNMDVAAFYAKWLRDLGDARFDDGRVPPVAPLPPGQRLLAVDGGPGWSDAVVIVPWQLYRCYGDRRVLERNFPHVRAFLDNLVERYPDLIREDTGDDPWQGFGDPRAGHNGAGPAQVGFAGTARDLVGTAFFYYSARLAARSAGVLGRLSDLERFEELAQRIKAAFRRRFVTAGGRLVGESQTGYVLALHFGLLETEQREQALRLLIGDVEARRGEVSTGFIGVPYLLQVLTDADRLDVAYRVLLQSDAPGWLRSVAEGASTVWALGAGSGHDAARQAVNHYACGAVGEWLYSACAGLDLDPELSTERNAYRHVLVRPRPPLGDGFPDGPPIRQVEAALDTVHGRFEVFWELAEVQFRLRVGVPVGCSATVHMPDGGVHDVVAGSHTFAQSLEHGADGIPVLREVTQIAS